MKNKYQCCTAERTASQVQQEKHEGKKTLSLGGNYKIFNHLVANPYSFIKWKVPDTDIVT